MTDPIYPDKTKTGLAALKPLTDAFFAEPERWVWELKVDASEYWAPQHDFYHAMKLLGVRHGNREIRLTPKPRRVWIGDQSYPEPLRDCEHDQPVYACDVSCGRVISTNFNQYGNHHINWLANGFIFSNPEHAQQCLDAYRKARRVE